ncbi:hypothetical protein THAOC_37335, partial [Thalassiosira oceanica]
MLGRGCLELEVCTTIPGILTTAANAIFKHPNQFICSNEALQLGVQYVTIPPHWVTHLDEWINRPHFQLTIATYKPSNNPKMMNFSIALVTLLLPSAVSAQRQLRTEQGKPDLASVDEKRPQPDKLTSVVERPQPDKFTSTIDFDVDVKPIKPPIGFLRPTQRPTRKIDIFRKPTQSPTPACESTCDTDE